MSLSVSMTDQILETMSAEFSDVPDVGQLTRIVVRLLLGEIPEHSEFQQLGLQKPLLPYFALTQAVRVGDLAAFS